MRARNPHAEPNETNETWGFFAPIGAQIDIKWKLTFPVFLSETLGYPQARLRVAKDLIFRIRIAHYPKKAILRDDLRLECRIGMTHRIEASREHEPRGKLEG